MQQPANLTQNFQLASNSVNNIKSANNIGDVQKYIVVTDTYFFNNDMTEMWIKNAKGNIRTFNMMEVIPKDEKDLLIEKLQKQIAELKGGNLNEPIKSDEELLYEQPITNVDKPIGKSTKTIKPTDVSDISNSKATKRKP